MSWKTLKGIFLMVKEKKSEEQKVSGQPEVNIGLVGQ